MTLYEKSLALWQGKRITNAAELAEALNGYSIAFRVWLFQWRA